MRALSASEHRTLAAAAACILPSDDGPGAEEAHVIGYIEWVLAHHATASHHARLMLAIRCLDGIARRRFERSFHECDRSERDAVLTELTSIRHAALEGFVRSLVNMTLAGFFC